MVLTCVVHGLSLSWTSLGLVDISGVGLSLGEAEVAQSGVVRVGAVVRVLPTGTVHQGHLTHSLLMVTDSLSITAYIQHIR